MPMFSQESSIGGSKYKRTPYKHTVSVFCFRAIFSTVRCMTYAKTVIAGFRKIVYNGYAIAKNIIKEVNFDDHR
jgi:hypothetical protein